MTEQQRDAVETAIFEAIEALEAAIEYAKDKGVPAPVRTRMRAVKAKIQDAAYLAAPQANKPLVERAIERVVVGWAKITGRA